VLCLARSTPGSWNQTHHYPLPTPAQTTSVNLDYLLSPARPDYHCYDNPSPSKPSQIHQTHGKPCETKLSRLRLKAPTCSFARHIALGAWIGIWKRGQAQCGSAHGSQRDGERRSTVMYIVLEPSNGLGRTATRYNHKNLHTSWRGQGCRTGVAVMCGL